MPAKWTFIRVFAAVFSALVFIIAKVKASDWHYPETESEEFPKWEGLCDSGEEQSPIALLEEEVLPMTFPDIIFQGYNEPLVNPVIENNGHTVQVTTDSKLTIKGGPLGSPYALIQFHFHWKSEHTVDGERYALEMHLVHMKTIYSSLDEAVKHRDGIAVVAVLFSASTTTNSVIEKILSELENVASSENVGNRKEMEETINLRNLFPLDLSANYFYYEGSLTTPPCSEAVLWIVYREAQEISTEQLDRFRNIQTKEGKYLKRNFRDIQPTNKRKVFFTVEISKSASVSVFEFNLLWQYLLNLKELIYCVLL